LRHAISLYARRSMDDAWSLGAGYRFYLDDWGLSSHTVRADLGFLLAQSTILAGRYRFYTQGAADHYKSVYPLPEPFMTSDKELSPMASHRIALELEHTFGFAGDETLTLSLSGAPVFYSYSDFQRLDSMTALEINAALAFAM
jgi:hypothetical protein